MSGAKHKEWDFPAFQIPLQAAKHPEILFLGIREPSLMNKCGCVWAEVQGGGAISKSYPLLPTCPFAKSNSVDGKCSDNLLNRSLLYSR